MLCLANRRYSVVLVTVHWSQYEKDAQFVRDCLLTLEIQLQAGSHHVSIGRRIYWHSTHGGNTPTCALGSGKGAPAMGKHASKALPYPPLVMVVRPCPKVLSAQLSKWL